MSTPSEKSRLTLETERVLNAPVAERIAHLRRDQWVGYGQAREILGEMNDLFAAPERLRMPNLLITGDPGNGKTHILSRFIRSHPSTVQPERYNSSIPIVMVNAPGIADAGALFGRILDRLATPYREKQSVESKMALAIEQLRKVGTKVVLIDEFHDVLNGTPLRQRQVVCSVKDFSNESRIAIVAAGTAAAYEAIRVDSQLELRFAQRDLPRWNYDPTDHANPFAKMLASFERLLPLPERSNLSNPAKAALIFNHAGSTIGRVADLVFRSAILAVEAKESCVTIAHIEEAVATARRSSAS